MYRKEDIDDIKKNIGKIQDNAMLTYKTNYEPTLTESKLPNVWYHEHFDWLCKYTPDGFKQEKMAFGGSKKILFERGFGRHIA